MPRVQAVLLLRQKGEGDNSIGEAEQPVVASGGLGAEDSP
jgi:hypothetical protein